MFVYTVSLTHTHMLYSTHPYSRTYTLMHAYVQTIIHARMYVIAHTEFTLLHVSVFRARTHVQTPTILHTPSMHTYRSNPKTTDFFEG